MPAEAVSRCPRWTLTRQVDRNRRPATAMIDLPGPKEARFDYLTMDDEDHYLLSAHLGPGIFQLQARPQHCVR